jgi:hypothetical protein
MATLNAIRDAIKTTLKANLPGVHIYDNVPDVQEVPCVIVLPIMADFTVAFARGSDTWQFDLVVSVSRVDVQDGQEQLDKYVSGSGAKSIRQIIFNNPTLGLADTDAHIKSMKGYGGNFDTAGNNYVGALLRLVVVTSGTA